MAASATPIVETALVGGSKNPLRATNLEMAGCLIPAAILALILLAVILFKRD